MTIIQYTNHEESNYDSDKLYHFRLLKDNEGLYFNGIRRSAYYESSSKIIAELK